MLPVRMFLQKAFACDEGLCLIRIMVAKKTEGIAMKKSSEEEIKRALEEKLLRERKMGPRDPFVRAENEDDDGYDPYSDRRPAREPLFQHDPWA